MKAWSQDQEERETYRVDLYERYLSLLASHLNDIHGENHDRRYWELIIGPWLIFFIWYTHYRYTTAEPCEILPEPAKRRFLVPYDYLSFNYMFEKTDYPTQLDRHLFTGTDDHELFPSECVKFSPVQWGPIKKTLRGLVSSVAQKLFLNKARIALVSPYISPGAQLKLVLLSRFRALPLFFQDGAQPSKAVERQLRNWRIAPPQDSADDEFARRLHRILLKHMPYIHLEGYKDLKKNISVPSGLKVLFSSTAWNQEEIFKVFAAVAREKGVKLVGNQHGGLYGIGKAWPLEYEERITDLFLTWGWKGSERSYPFYGLKLSEVVKEYKKLTRDTKGQENVLYVTTSGSRFWPDGLGTPSDRQFVNYLDWQVLFLKLLEPSCLSEVVVRLLPREDFYGWDQRSRIESQGIEVRFNNSDSYLEALSKTKLVVADNNFTTPLESYACGIPTVLFFDRNLWPIHERAQSLFSRMEKVGLFHHTPESAAKHVSKIRKDPVAWWNDAEVLPVREEFRRSFAWTSPQALEKVTGLLLAPPLSGCSQRAILQ